MTSAQKAIKYIPDANEYGGDTFQYITIDNDGNYGDVIHSFVNDGNEASPDWKRKIIE